ncbi:hypothetical protein ACP275_06G107300 [Erythranthe tilingii]
MDSSHLNDDKSESRLYIGNLDLRITEATLIKMFCPYGKIISEEFLWHTRGPKRGEPRGYAFIQFGSKEEAIRAKEKMHGRMACGRPLVVRLASEKDPFEGLANSSKSVEGTRSSSLSGSGCGQIINRSAKIAAIKNKLKAMDDEESYKNSKKRKQIDTPCTDSHKNPSPER